MYIQNASIQSVNQMFAQTNLAHNENTFIPKKLEQTPADEVDKKVALKGFSEKAVFVFESMSADMSQKEKATALESLTSIGKAAAFASTNGYESQKEKLVVSQYFGNFDGVLSDEAIKRMIYTKLNNVNIDNREFLKEFASALDAPLQRINITI